MQEEIDPFHLSLPNPTFQEVEPDEDDEEIDEEEIEEEEEEEEEE